MKIDTNTTLILKNFAKINPSLLIEEGNTLVTVSPSKTIKAKAKVTTDFPQRFAIYNLDQFLSTLSLFTDPELTFKDTYVKIADEQRSSSNFVYADENVITKVPDKDIKLPSVDAQFSLKNSDLKEIEKAAGVLSLPEIAVVGENGKIYLKAVDSKNPSGNQFQIAVGDTKKVFNVIFKLENLKMIPGDYEVSICSRGISYFEGKEAEYWIAIERNSTFE